MYFCGHHNNQGSQDLGNKSNRAIYQYSGTRNHRDQCKCSFAGHHSSCRCPYNGGSGNVSHHPAHQCTSHFSHASWQNRSQDLAPIEWTKGNSSQNWPRKSSSKEWKNKSKVSLTSSLKSKHRYDDSRHNVQETSLVSPSKIKHQHPGLNNPHKASCHHHPPHMVYINTYSSKQTVPQLQKHSDQQRMSDKASNTRSEKSKRYNCSCYAISKPNTPWDQRGPVKRSTERLERNSPLQDHNSQSTAVENCLRRIKATKKPNNYHYHIRERPKYQEKKPEVSDWQDYYKELTGCSEEDDPKMNALYSRSLVDHTKELAERLKERKTQYEDRKDHRDCCKEHIRDSQKDQFKDRTTNRSKDTWQHDGACVADAYPVYLE